MTEQAKYALATIHTGDFSGRALDSMMALKKPPPGAYWIRIPDLPVDLAREEAAERFLAANEGTLEYMLMVDKDMELHPDSFLRLASHKVDMVAGLCVSRHWPYPPVMFRGVAKVREDGREFLTVQVRETFDWLLRNPEAMTLEPAVLDPAPADSLREFDGTGAACLLVHRRVFEALEQPWFLRDRPKRGEDFSFFQKARKAGYQLWADRSVIVGHQVQTVVTPGHAMAAMFGEAFLEGLKDSGEAEQQATLQQMLGGLEFIT